MNIKMQIHYYNALLVESMQTNMFDAETTLKSKINKFKSEHSQDEKRYKSSDEKYIVDIIDIEENTIFGSVGKLSSYEDKLLERRRELPDYQIKTELNKDDILEEYTYFLFNFDNLKCNIIYSKKVGNFAKIFAEFLRLHFKLSGIYDKVEMLPIKSTNIPERIHRAEKLETVEFKYSSKSKTTDKFLFPLQMKQLSNSVRVAKVTLTLQSNISEKHIKDLKKEISEKNYNEFDGFTVQTDKEIIDLVNNHIIEKKNITLDKDVLKDIKKIKRTLMENFNPH